MTTNDIHPNMALYRRLRHDRIFVRVTQWSR